MSQNSDAPDVSFTSHSGRAITAIGALTILSMMRGSDDVG